MTPIPLQVKVKGYFILVKHQCDENGEVIPGTAEHVAEFENLITDTGLDMLGAQLARGYVLVGSGSTAPAFTDTSLVARIASTNAATVQTASYVAGPPEYGQVLYTWRFTAGAAAGNLAEIGIAGGVSGPLFSRALILDGGGSPTTITILSTEALDCTYVLRVFTPTGDVSFSGANGANVVGVGMCNFTVRPASVGSWGSLLSNWPYSAPSCQAYDGAIGSRATQPTGNQSTGVATWGAYSNGSRSRILTCTFDLTHGNFANGIQAFNLSGFGYFQVGIDSGANIPKTANMTLSTTFNFSVSR